MSSMEDGHYGRVRFVHGPSDSPRCADPRQEDEATRTMGPPARARGGASERACSGHIESIELVNFMCHRHLLINLNPHINFIIGNNGSGKSAILSALTICLGGRASITQRATSLDSLIREGASSGKIRLKLNNEGDNPYEPSVFGRHIFIERNLRRDGGNSYAILNESGGQVSARKDDINSICDHFGIQVDNPLAVLTQEVAKKFLASAKPRELYEFFMKATQLEQLSVDYTYALERLNESRSKLGISQNSLLPLCEKIQTLESQLVSLERQKFAHREIQRLRGEMTWALIGQKEAESEQLASEVEERRRDIDDLRAKIGSLREQYQEIESLIAGSEGTLSSAQRQLDSLVSEKASLTTEIKSVEQTLEELKFDLKAMNAEFSQLRSQAAEINGKIKEEARRSGSERKASLQERLRELDLEQPMVNGRISDEQKNEEALLKRCVEVDAQLEGLRSRRDEITRHAESLNKALVRAQGSKNDRVKAFGENMSAALSDIKRHSSTFSRPPIGPAGLHIKLLDGSWSKAMEAILHSSVESFIVNDHLDRGKLQKILQRHNLHNPIVVLGFDGEIDISSGLPDPRFRTALSLLEIDNAVVRKMLVILNQVECNVLIEDRHSAINVMKTSPTNVHAIYTRELRMIHGSRSISVNNIYSNPRLPQLLEDPEARILELRAKTAEVSAQKSAIDRDLAALVEEQESCRQRLQSSRSTLDDLMRKLRSLKLEARQIQDELEGDDSSFSQSYLQQELASIDSRMSALESQVRANDRQKSELGSRKTHLLTCLRQIDESVQMAKREHERIVAEISSSVGTRRGVEKEVERMERIVERECSLLREAETGLHKHHAELEEMRADASNICPRVPVLRSVAELDMELTAQEEGLRLHQQQQQIDPLQIKEELERRRLQLREAERSVAVNERVIRTLSLSLDQRQKAWEDFRRSVSKMSNTEFIFMLTARGFQGCLEYRHFESELLIKVIPQGQQEASTGGNEQGRSGGNLSKRRKSEHASVTEDAGNRDIRQLSGGEKSYSTACFLFSLWHAMGSPLRCLDEFDVYMDPVNRNYILELLVAHARASRVQFILITPTAIPESYRHARDVRIHRLHDPERGQGVLQRGIADMNVVRQE